jgi:hypothetical protein
MFNLLISGNDEALRGDPWTLERNRVFEHTHEAVAAPYRDLSQQQVEQMCRFPALIGYERAVGRNARIARIDRIRLREAEVRVEYSFVPGLPEITSEQLEGLAWELDIGRYELNRTHWALKDVDLFAELESAGIMSGELYSSVPTEFRTLFYGSSPPAIVSIQPTIFRVPEQPLEEDLVSVMYPFNAAFVPVFQTIEDVGASLGLRVMSANQVWEASEIIQDIFSLIYRSSIVICDFTDQNPNVFYEAGIAHTLGKPVVPLVQRVSDIPFDLRQHRHIVYLNNEEGRRGLSEELRPRLQHLARRGR